MIKELNVDWASEHLALAEASFFEQPQTKRGWMEVVFYDLDGMYEFPSYLVLATPYSKLAEEEGIPTIQTVVDRKRSVDGLIAHSLFLEPGYEYGVEVYALSKGQGVRLSAPTDVEYQTTLLGPLYFGAYQVNVLFGCNQPAVVTEECTITPETKNFEIQTELPLEGGWQNSHVLAMAGEPNSSPDTRIVYFLDPTTFGPGEYVRSDKAGQATHVELTVRPVKEVNPNSNAIAYRHRIRLEDEDNWVVSEHYYCRALIEDSNGAQDNLAGRCLGPLTPGTGGVEVQSNPERFRTSYAISMGVPDGIYILELVAQAAKKDENTGKLTYEAVSAPANLRAEIGRPNIFSFSAQEYIRLLSDIEAEFKSDDEDLDLTYWTELLFPNFDKGESINFALEDLGIKLNLQVK